MNLQYQLNDQLHTLFLQRRHEWLELAIDDRPVQTKVHWLNQHHGTIEYNHHHFAFYAAQNDQQIFVHMFGHHWILQRKDGFSQSKDQQSGSGQVRAPMPGVVIEIQVAANQSVREGDTLMLIESMKLQTEIKAEHDGTVSEIGLSAGASFDKGALLVEVTPCNLSSED